MYPDLVRQRQKRLTNQQSLEFLKNLKPVTEEEVLASVKTGKPHKP